MTTPHPAQTLPIGPLLDRWRQASAEDKAAMRPILLTRLMQGNLVPADRLELISALRPDSLPQSAPTR